MDYQHLKSKSDEELEKLIGTNAQLESPASNLAVAEITRRTIEANRKSICELKEVIKDFSTSSEKYSKRIVHLTWGLVGLTVVLVILTIMLAIQSF